jgi:hypothetical protein
MCIHLSESLVLTMCVSLGAICLVDLMDVPCVGDLFG